mmetsp:Transcript_110509/g.312592  ORF Transcript_110509/g.312592 Transcript_110509/m.312592 type:complete len:606 (+) Transcript_110509:122-1939(+)
MPGACSTGSVRPLHVCAEVSTLYKLRPCAGEGCRDGCWDGPAEADLRHLQGREALGVADVRLRPGLQEQLDLHGVPGLARGVERRAALPRGHLRHHRVAPHGLGKEPRRAEERAEELRAGLHLDAGVLGPRQDHAQDLGGRLRVRADGMEGGGAVGGCVVHVPAGRQQQAYRVVRDERAGGRQDQRVAGVRVAPLDVLRGEAHQPARDVRRAGVHAGPLERVPAPPAALPGGVRPGVQERLDDLEVRDRHGAHQRRHALHDTELRVLAVCEVLEPVLRAGEALLEHRDVAREHGELHHGPLRLPLGVRAQQPCHVVAAGRHVPRDRRLEALHEAVAQAEEVHVLVVHGSLLQVGRVRPDHRLQHPPDFALVALDPPPVDAVAAGTAGELAGPGGELEDVQGHLYVGGALRALADDDVGPGGRQVRRRQLQAAPAPGAPARVVAHLAGLAVLADRHEDEHEAGPLDVAGDGVHGLPQGLGGLPLGVAGGLDEAVVGGLRRGAADAGELRHRHEVEPDVHGADFRRPLARGYRRGDLVGELGHPVRLDVDLPRGKPLEDALERPEVLPRGVSVAEAQPLVADEDDFAVHGGLPLFQQALRQQDLVRL